MEDWYIDVCSRVARGESINTILGDAELNTRLGYQSVADFWQMTFENDDCYNTYLRAKVLRAEVYTNEMIDIADNCGTDKDEIAKAKLQIQVRLVEVQAKLPEEYGKKVSLHVETDNAASVLDFIDAMDTVDQKRSQKNDVVIYEVDKE